MRNMYSPSEVKCEIYKACRELKIPPVYIRNEDLNFMSEKQLNMVLNGFKRVMTSYLALRRKKASHNLKD